MVWSVPEARMIRQLDNVELLGGCFSSNDRFLALAGRWRVVVFEMASEEHAVLDYVNVLY